VLRKSCPHLPKPVTPQALVEVLEKWLPKEVAQKRE
jgi:hypothetical protein